uniref:CSON009857 protein n=1 Tax=Culicoides sonorensis TaxID=179676 RepID=A0A336N3D6_CULSO
MLKLNPKFSLLIITIVLLILGSITNATRCYKCTEGGLIRDVRNCGKNVECRYGCKITQVLSSEEVVVEQDCFEMTFPFSGTNNNNNNPTYIPSSQYPQGQIPPVIFNPHNPNNREYNSGWDSYNNNNTGTRGGCSTLSAIQRFRSLFPYASGYSATCNTCDWDYCNSYNGANHKKTNIVSLMIVSFIGLFKSFF